ncbi:MAG: PorV/PorQ family protein [Chitinophagaceae bacterium]|nr:PorV/PorQ family protein [Chitinophagaceae bacterium]
MNRIVFITISTLLLCHFSARAQFRKYSNEFLNIGAGARSLGMGGASIATADGATAGYWNPARLAAVRDNPQLSLMHAEYFSGIGKYDFAGIAIPMQDNRRTLGISLLRFGIDDIPNTLFLVEPDGRPNYNNIETFSSADYALMVGMNQMLYETDNRELSIGGNVKIIHRNVGSFAKAWGFGIDAGINYRAERWSVGAVLRDATSTFNMWSFRFTEREKQALYLTRNDIPQTSTELTAPRLLIGGAYGFMLTEKIELLAELQLDNTFDGKRNTVISTDFISIDPRLGLELNVGEVFSVRGGVSNFQQALKDGDSTNTQKTWIFQPALGAGFKIKNVKIDYAFTNLANQTSPLYTHIISLSVDLKRKEN